MAAQLVLEFPQEEDYSAANFLRMPFNTAAVQAATTLQQGGVVVYGPSGVGKTHLARVWAAANHAAYLSPTAWPQSFAQALQSGVKKWAIDDVQNLTPNQQEDFFHLLNYVKNEGGALLVTLNKPVKEVPLIPEISSRLATYQQAEISQPKGEDLKTLLLKLAADKQWNLPENVISYFLNHSGRSVVELIDNINKIDKKSLSQKRRITVQLIKEILL